MCRSMSRYLPMELEGLCDVISMAFLTDDVKYCKTDPSRRLRAHCMQLDLNCVEGREDRFCDVEVRNEASASQDQCVPCRVGSDTIMLVAPIFEEHASIEGLGQDRPANAMGDVPKAQNRSSGFFLQRSLLKALCGQLMQCMFFAFEDLQEGQVCFGPALDDR